MQDSAKNKIEVGHLVDIFAVAVTKIEGESITVDLGRGHCVTLNKSQVKANVQTTGEFAPEPTLIEPEVVHSDMEVTAGETGGLKDIST